MVPEGARIVLDCVGERKAPFSPASVVEEFAGVLRQYRVSTAPVADTPDAVAGPPKTEVAYPEQ